MVEGVLGKPGREATGSEKAKASTRRRFEGLAKALPHLSRLVAFARRFSDADAEDYVQDAFARALRSFEQIGDERAVRSWLYRTVASEDQRTLARRRQLLHVSQLEARHEDLVASGDAGPLGGAARRAVVAAPARGARLAP